VVGRRGAQAREGRSFERKTGGEAARGGDQCSVIDLEKELVFLGVEACGGDGPGSAGFVELEESAGHVRGRAHPEQRRSRIKTVSAGSDSICD
jgi:hypothetical protein